VKMSYQMSSAISSSAPRGSGGLVLGLHGSGSEGRRDVEGVEEEDDDDEAMALSGAI
jgi:hypothetical protein